MIRTIRARYSGGMLEPLEPLALEEGEEIELTLEEQVHESEEAEDAAFARAMEEAMTTERVSEQEIRAILRERDEAAAAVRD
ncbi:MAG: antitoxin family protein [Chloroflexi bacterium]|nr:antitoxin family protein [Chloroflexota bacterium]